MYAAIQSLLQDQADLFCAGNFEELEALYQLPFVAYHNGVPTYVENRNKAFKVLAKIKSVLTSRGVEKFDVGVTSVELPKNGRFRVWSTLHEINGRGEVISGIDVLHYFTEKDESSFVQMIEVKTGANALANTVRSSSIN